MPTSALSPADLRNYLGFGFQVSKGTEVAPVHFLSFMGQINFDHNPNIRAVKEAGGGQITARLVKDYIAPGVEAATAIRPSIIGALAAACLGTDTISGVGPYTHTITRNPDPVWLTFERSISDDVIERIVDGQIIGLTINYQKRDQGPELMATMTAIGISEEVEAAATAESYEAALPLTRSDCTWTLDGNPATNIESATVDIQWQVDDTILADPVTRSSIVKLHFTVAIEVVQLFESAAEKDAYLATHYGTPAGTSPSEVIYQGDLNVAALDTGLGFTVDCPQIDWSIAELTEPDPDASEAVRITRRGEVTQGAGEPITITAVNNDTPAYV